MNNDLHSTRKDYGIPNDYPFIVNNERWEIYIPRFDEGTFFVYTSARVRADGMPIRLIGIRDDELFYLTERGELWSVDYITGYQSHYPAHHPIVDKGDSIWMEGKHAASFDIIKTYRFAKFEHPSVLWNIYNMHLAHGQIIQGLTAQFILTGVTIEHLFASNRYAMRIGDKHLSLQHLCELITESKKDGKKIEAMEKLLGSKSSVSEPKAEL